jgi:hypothetical protein
MGVLPHQDALPVVIGSHEQRNLAEEKVDWYNQVRNEVYATTCL